MATEGAITDALERIAHRINKGPRWVEKERLEWHRCAAVLDTEDADLEKAVSSLVAGKDTYNLDLLLSKIGKKRQARPAGDGCPICTGGMIELAVWRGDDISASNPEITTIRCRCNKGALIKDTCYLLRQKDQTITEIYVSVEKVDGYLQRRRMNREETGEIQRKRMREAGIHWPGSVPWMRPMQEPTPVARTAPQAPQSAASMVAAAMQQLNRLDP